MNENERIKILIVDDHEIMVDGLTALLSDIPDIQIAGSASDTNQLFALLTTTKPDLLLLDIGLVPLSGIEALKIIKDKYPEIKCIMLSALVEAEKVIEALSAGARGYLSKNILAGELVKAIHEVYHGNNYIAEALRSQVLSRLFNHSEPRTKQHTELLAQLTGRETEIVKLFASGFSYKEIAAKLQISPRTVESHKNNIQSKLGISTTTELIKFAIKSKLIDL